MKSAKTTEGSSGKSAGQPTRCRLLIANGVNLDLLGSREPHIYGHATLSDLAAMSKTWEGDATQAGAPCQIDLFQTNDEAAYLAKISDPDYDGMILNPGAWTHTSLALRDRILALQTCFVEVHVSNTAAREEIRRKSLIADLAIGVIQGFGLQGYHFAVLALIARIQPDPVKIPLRRPPS